MSASKRKSAAMFMRQAVQCFEGGDLAGAQKLVKKYLSVDPSNPDANHLLGVVFLQRGDGLGAVNAISRALKANPKMAMAHNNLGEAYRAIGEDEKAEAGYRAAIALQPKVGGFYNNLGIALQGQGKEGAAKDAHEKALELEPDNPVAMTNLANLLCNMDDIVGAIALHKRALAVAPRYAEAHANYGVALQSIGEYDKAIAEFREAVRLNPGHVNARLNLANILEKHGQIVDSITHYREAISADPANRGAYFALAELLRGAGRAREALDVYRQLERLDPSRPRLQMDIGNLYLSMGDRDSAIGHFRKALDLDPGHARALDAIAQITSHADANDPAIGMVRARRDEEHCTDEDRMVLEFVLAKILDDLGAHSEAMTHFNEGNRLKRSTLEYEHDKFVKLVSGLKAVFNETFFEATKGWGNPDARPIFIVGMPRSGTTLVEQILASHSGIIGGGELNDLNFVFKRHEIQSKFAGELFPENLAALSGEEFYRIGKAYESAVAGRFGRDSLVTDKLPHNFLRVGLIRAALPNAKVIHCRRDPIDTCLSIYKNRFSGEHDYAYDQIELGQHYRVYDDLMVHWSTVLPGFMHEVRYEDLVGDLKENARALIAFCDVPWDDQCLAFHKTKRLVNTVSAAQVRQPIYRRSVAAWKRYESELKALIDTLGDLASGSATE